MNWTLPAIDHENKVIMDSFAIAKYLENTFADAPLLFPNKSVAPLAMLLQTYFQTQIQLPLFPLVLPVQIDFLDEEGGKYFRRTREERFGYTITHDIYNDKERIDKIWEEVSKATKVVGNMLRENQGGPYLAGHDRTYADLVIMSFLEWFRVVVPDIFERTLDLEPEFKDLYEACKELL